MDQADKGGNGNGVRNGVNSVFSLFLPAVSKIVKNRVDPFFSYASILGYPGAKAAQYDF